MPEPLYKVCRLTAEHLETFDPSEIEPDVVFGPASIDACLLFAGRGLQTDFFLAEQEEETQ